MRLEREHADRAWMAWHIAALPRAKKFPEFHKFTGIKAPAPRKAAPEEIEAKVRAWLKSGA